MSRRAQGARGVYRATVALPAPGRWTLSVRVDGGVSGGRGVRAVPPKIALPFSVTVARGVVFVGDATSGRVIRFGSRGPVVHASGLVEPTGLAPAPAGGLYAADFAAGVVRRVAANGRVSTLARLPQVTAVASAGSDIYAVTMDGVLARISSRGAVTRIPVPGGLDRPHGVVVDRDGSLLIGEDSRRVRRVDPASGRATLVVGDVDTNKIAVAADGTLFLAGSTLTGGTLRRLTPDGVLSTPDLRPARQRRRGAAGRRRRDHDGRARRGPARRSSYGSSSPVRAVRLSREASASSGPGRGRAARRG